MELQTVDIFHYSKRFEDNIKTMQDKSEGKKMEASRLQTSDDQLCADDGCTRLCKSNLKCNKLLPLLERHLEL